VSHFCDIWRHWSESTSQLIPFCLTTTRIIAETRSLKNFGWLLHRPYCWLGSNLKYWLRLQPKMQTPAGVHSGTVIIPGPHQIKHYVHRCGSTQLFGVCRIFAQIFPNLPEKFLCDFAYIFLPQRSWRTLFFICPPKKAFMYFLQTLGSFFEINNVEHHFCLDFQGFCSDIPGFWTDFRQIETFGEPPPATPLIMSRPLVPCLETICMTSFADVNLHQFLLFAHFTGLMLFADLHISSII